MIDPVLLGRITLRELSVMNEAKRLQLVDEELHTYKQAWANQQARAKKNVGTDKKPKIVPLFSDFKDFYDYEKRLEEVFDQNDTPSIEEDTTLMDLYLKASQS